MKVKAIVCAVLVTMSLHLNITAQERDDNQQLIFPAENTASSESNTGGSTSVVAEREWQHHDNTFPFLTKQS